VSVQVIRVDLERRQIDLGLTAILDAVRVSERGRPPRSKAPRRKGERERAAASRPAPSRGRPGQRARTPRAPGRRRRR
jgi:hypothetical protein